MPCTFYSGTIFICEFLGYWGTFYVIICLSTLCVTHCNMKEFPHVPNVQNFKSHPGTHVYLTFSVFYFVSTVLCITGIFNILFSLKYGIFKFEKNFRKFHCSEPGLVISVSPNFPRSHPTSPVSCILRCFWYATYMLAYINFS